MTVSARKTSDEQMMERLKQHIDAGFILTPDLVMLHVAGTKNQERLRSVLERAFAKREELPFTLQLVMTLIAIHNQIDNKTVFERLAQTGSVPPLQNTTTKREN